MLVNVIRGRLIESQTQAIGDQIGACRWVVIDQSAGYWRLYPVLINALAACRFVNDSMNNKSLHIETIHIVLTACRIEAVLAMLRVIIRFKAEGTTTRTSRIAFTHLAILNELLKIV
jgi:hypothetical protein